MSKQSDLAVVARDAGTGYVNVAGDTMTGELITPRATITDVFYPSSGYSAWKQTNYFGDLYLNNGPDRFKIDAAGRVTMPYQPAFNVFYSLNNGFSWSAGAVFPHDSVRFDRGNNFNTSNYRFTAPVAGVYLFEFQTIQLGVINNLAVAFRVNGGVAEGSRTHVSNYGSGWQRVSTAKAILLNIGDYVDVSNTGPTSTYHGGSWQNFSGYLLG